MTYKRISATIPEWIYNTYLSNAKNKSFLISELIVKGYDAETSKASSMKQQILKLIGENRRLSEDIKQLKAQLARYHKGKRIPSDAEKMATAYKNRGLMG